MHKAWKRGLLRQRLDIPSPVAFTWHFEGLVLRLKNQHVLPLFLQIKKEDAYFHKTHYSQQLFGCFVLFSGKARENIRGIFEFLLCHPVNWESWQWVVKSRERSLKAYSCSLTVGTSRKRTHCY
jgi:hypothetical protein